MEVVPKELAVKETLPQRSLWRNYLAVLKRPSAVLKQEKEYASWIGVFKNLLLSFCILTITAILLFVVIINILANIVAKAPVNVSNNVTNISSVVTLFLAIGDFIFAGYITFVIVLLIIASLIFFIESFFVVQAIIFGFSKFFNGKASFKEQAYLSSFFLPGLAVCIAMFWIILGIFSIVQINLLFTSPSKMIAGDALSWFIMLIIAITIGFIVYSVILQIKCLKVAHEYSNVKAFLSWFFVAMIATLIAFIIFKKLGWLDLLIKFLRTGELKIEFHG